MFTLTKHLAGPLALRDWFIGRYDEFRRRRMARYARLLAEHEEMARNAPRKPVQ